MNCEACKALVPDGATQCPLCGATTLTAAPVVAETPAAVPQPAPVNPETDLLNSQSLLFPAEPTPSTFDAPSVAYPAEIYSTPQPQAYQPPAQPGYTAPQTQSYAPPSYNTGYTAPQPTYTPPVQPAYTPPQPSYQQPVYPSYPPVQPTYNPNPYYHPQVPAKTDTASFVLGIVGIVFSLLIPLVALCTSIPGLVMAVNREKEGYPVRKSCKIMNIIALVIAGVTIFINFMT